MQELEVPSAPGGGDVPLADEPEKPRRPVLLAASALVLVCSMTYSFYARFPTRTRAWIPPRWPVWGEQMLMLALGAAAVLLIGATVAGSLGAWRGHARGAAALTIAAYANLCLNVVAVVVPRWPGVGGRSEAATCIALVLVCLPCLWAPSARRYYRASAAYRREVIEWHPDAPADPPAEEP